MRLVTCRDAEGIFPGVVLGDDVVSLSALAPDMLALIALGSAWRAAVEKQLDQAPRRPLDRVQLRAPIPRPARNIICLGMNYAAHAIESQRTRGLPAKLPEHPVFFTKAPSTVVGPFDDVPLHQRVTSQLDWEVELAVVIGAGGRDIPRERALEHVFGYTIINDVTARDLQNRHQQFFKGKSLDGTCPMGPWIVTADELPPGGAGLRLSLMVNETLRQDSTTDDLIFDVPTIIAVLSAGMTLEPGDIISTGTPAGVGMGLSPQVWLRDGDVMLAEVEGIGALRNRVVPD